MNCPNCREARFIVKAFVGLWLCVPIILLMVASLFLAVAAVPFYFALQGAGCTFYNDPLDWIIDKWGGLLEWWKEL